MPNDSCLTPSHADPAPPPPLPNHIPLLNLIDDVHARDDAAEDGVLRVEMRLRRVRDEVLAAAGVRPRIERHADGAAQVGALVELVADRIARSAFAVAARIAVLNHEVGHDAVDAQAVEVAL